MCSLPTAGESLLHGLMLTTPTVLLPLALALVAWRRGSRSWAGLAALASVAGLLVVALAFEPSANAPTTPILEQRRAWVALVPPILGVAALAWLATLAARAPPVRHVALALNVGAFLVMLAVVVHMSVTGSADCNFVMGSPPSPTPPAD